MHVMNERCTALAYNTNESKEQNKTVLRQQSWCGKANSFLTRKTNVKSKAFTNEVAQQMNY